MLIRNPDPELNWLINVLLYNSAIRDPRTANKGSTAIRVVTNLKISSWNAGFKSSKNKIFKKSPGKNLFTKFNFELEGSPIIKINKYNYLLFGYDFSSRILRRKFWLYLMVSNGVSMSSKCKWVQKQGFEVRCSCLEYFIDVSFSLFTFKIILHFTFWFL